MPDNKNNNINPKDDVENLNFDDDSIDIELEDLTLDDGKVDLKIDSVKPAGDVSVNPASSVSDASASEGAASTTGASSDSSTPAQEANSDASAPTASSAPESTSGDNTANESSSEPSSSPSEAPVDNANNQNGDNSGSQQEAEKARKQEDKNQKDLQNKQNKDNRAKNDSNNQRNNLNDNQNDRNNGTNQNNQDKNQNKDNKNNQNNKGNDNKNNNTGSDKKSSPKNGLDKKRDELKDKWNNRPKTPKDFANRAGNGIKNGAKNAFNNSKAGQAVNRAKNAAQKAKQAAQKAKQAAKKVKEAKKVATTIKILLTSKVFLAILLAILVFGMLIFAVSFFVSGSPLVGGEVEDEDNLSKYSEVDQKTIEKLKNISEDYPNGDPALAMVTAIYPYMEELHGGNVNALKSNNDTDEYEDSEDEEDETLVSDEDSEDTVDNEDDLTEDDPYLELLRGWSFRTFKFKKLLKKTVDGEEEYNNYLKNTYFKSDKGYKAMFDGADEEALADAIIKDLYNLKDDFQGYFFEICVTNTSFESLGQVTINYENDDGISLQDLLTKNIYVDVKKEGCTATGKLTECESLYDNPIPLGKYIIGVTLQEVGNDLDNVEHIKANMVAEKSFAINRAFSRGNVSKVDDNTYVIGIIDSTRDQDYCDYETGESCSSGNKNPSETAVANLEKAWEESKYNYLSKKSEGEDIRLMGSVCQNQSYAEACSCSDGSCLFQEEVKNGYPTEKFDDILIDQFSNASPAILTIEGGFISGEIGSTTELCGDDVSGGIPDSEFKFYYQTDYPDTPFCGLDSVAGCKDEGGENTICTSGCGVTSYAMVIATLSDTEGNFDPIAANNEATSSGSCGVTGTSNGLFTNIGNNHSGFTVEQLPVTKEGANEVLSVLQNGGVVVANVQKPSPFTQGGHWIVIRGLTSDGGVKVADPNSETISKTKVYDINEFIEKNWLVDEEGVTHSWFAIYGPKSEQYKYTAGDGVATGTLGYPVEGVTGCDASDYPYYANGNYHGGTDINRSVGASSGMNILAADGGTVKTVKNLNYSYGSHVIIDHGNGYTTLYAHMQKGSITVNEGDTVSKGQIIGKLGSTGKSTGPHLHIELRKNNSHTNTLNPCEYIGQNKSYVGQ